MLLQLPFSATVARVMLNGGAACQLLFCLANGGFGWSCVAELCSHLATFATCRKKCIIILYNVHAPKSSAMSLRTGRKVGTRDNRTACETELRISLLPISFTNNNHVNKNLTRDHHVFL